MTLRRFTEADAPLVLLLNSDPAVLKYIHEPVLQTTEDALSILRTHILPQYKINLGRWAIHTKADNTFIGWCGLKHLAETNEIDLGYRLLPECWGQGFATEAAKHTLDYGLHALNLQIITARAKIENTASIKVLEKTGMQFLKNETVDDCSVKTYVALKR